ncbi:MAG TPA: 4-hydroxythreonine-4-phosphate dehydrogenase PdxA [Sandaracinaceae bacterium LLY-WYZ-13_1]|nr:4-hydroxythreonine-4-phosphate dehydrogenase PdxA [Sandaracinaceae bacterium LLY-WYZ-13_1]
MSARLHVSTGDPAGVGPEIAARAARELASERRLVLYGDRARLVAALEGTPVLDASDPAPAGMSVVDTGAVPDEVVAARAPTPQGGRAQLAALDAAIDAARTDGGAVVTAPTSKAAIERAGVPFTGQTEHLARRAGLAEDAVTMMFLGPRLRVALATTHLALRAVPDAVTAPRVERAVAHLLEALGRLGLATPRVVVAALNPHAGEQGLFGHEDAEVLARAVHAFADTPGVEGPIGAETAFRRAAAGDVDAVVAMYHDQATIASKLLDWGEAVNVTWGLPFVRTSVDHGVAYDAAAAGTVSVDGMRAALALAARLTEAR